MNEEGVKKLAQLSRLELIDSEISEYAGEFSEILSYVDSLKNAVSESANSDLILENSSNRNIVREDIESNESGHHTEKLIAVTPSSENNYIKVKKIL
jgi:aspartyl/glutamyl-tRNA(Asn/Gln) amidotransferase C subunit